MSFDYSGERYGVAVVVAVVAAQNLPRRVE